MTSINPVLLNVSMDSRIWIFDLNNDNLEDIIFLDTNSFELKALVQNNLNNWQINESIFSAKKPKIQTGAMGITDDFSILQKDFNGDGLKDLIIYILGEKLDGKNFTGMPPLYYIAQPDGSLKYSSAISDAYQSLVTSNSIGLIKAGVQSNNFVSAKDVTAADIDLDGDIDLWVESVGGYNVGSHFLENQGGNKWDVNIYDRLNEIDRIVFKGETTPTAPNEYWRWGQALLVDINKDHYPDLILGQLRAHEWQINANSYIYLNDGSGYFSPTRESLITLPKPQFNDDWTKVFDIKSGDLNNDGLSDLVFLHVRDGDTTEAYINTSWKGWYIQLLIQTSKGDYEDHSWRLGSQISTSKQQSIPMDIDVKDLNGDGKLDLNINYRFGVEPDDGYPWLLIQDKYGVFNNVDSTWYYQDNTWFEKIPPTNYWSGQNTHAIDLNHDGSLEFVSVDQNGFPKANLVIKSYDSIQALSAQSNGRTFDGLSYRALDLDANAGTAAKVLGAVFGKSAVTNKHYVGIGLDLLDKGMSYETLAGLALSAAKASTNDQVVTTLWTNVVGSAPSAADKAPFIKMLEDGMTPGALARMAADTSINAVNINLVGLAQTGLEYTPFA